MNQGRQSGSDESGQTRTVPPRPEIEFLNCQARLQRLHDARMYSGWIDQISRNHVAIRLNESYPVTLGESFYVEISGPQARMTFKSTCSGIEGLEMATLGEFSQAIGHALSIDPMVTLDLFLMTDPQFFPPLAECRKYVGGLAATLRCREIEQDVRIRDVSMSGLCILANFQLIRGSIISIDVVTSHRRVTVEGEVRSCVKIGPDLYQLGTALMPMDRIQVIVWKQICQ